MTKIIRTEDLLIFHTAYLKGAGWTAEATNTLDHVFKLLPIGALALVN